MNNNNLTIEWAPFKVTENVSKEALLTAAEQIESQFLQQQKGYIRRELLQGKENQWVDLIYWATNEDAATAAEAANNSEACMAYFSLMTAMEEGGISHYALQKSWN